MNEGVSFVKMPRNCLSVSSTKKLTWNRVHSGSVLIHSDPRSSDRFYRRQTVAKGNRGVKSIRRCWGGGHRSVPHGIFYGALPVELDIAISDLEAAISRASPLTRLARGSDVFG